MTAPDPNTAPNANTPIATHPIDAEGVWREICAGARHGGAALFLDRDGVVVADTDYLCRVEDIAIIPGAAATIAAANRRGVAVGARYEPGRHRPWLLRLGRVCRGAERHRRAPRDGRRAARLRLRLPASPRRHRAFPPPRSSRPQAQPGMILRAAADLALNLHRSWLVGDKASDIDAAKRAGLAGALLVMTGYGESERAQVASLAAADLKSASERPSPRHSRCRFSRPYRSPAVGISTLRCRRRATEDQRRGFFPGRPRKFRAYEGFVPARGSADPRSMTSMSRTRRPRRLDRGRARSARPFRARHRRSRRSPPCRARRPRSPEARTLRKARDKRRTPPAP